MLLHSLYLHHFRNHEDSYLRFGPHFNLLYGSNGQGKTSVLEAIHYLMMGRSFRTTQGGELIQHGATSFYIEAHFTKHHVEQRLRIAFAEKERKILYNSTSLTTLSSLLGIIQGVVMTPDDIQLIKGPPALRRQFLDMHIAQLDPLYVHHLTRYNRAMRQRNYLLKNKQLLTIESWEHEMSQSAAYITHQRAKTIQSVQADCQPIYALLTNGSEPFGIIYETNISNLSNLAHIQQEQKNLLEKHRSRELMLGYTVTGPHKDDLTFTSGDKDIRHFASEGQQRTCVTTLRLAEWQHLNRMSEEPPLMMIDDVGMNLDSYRRDRLMDYLSRLNQVFLSSTQDTLFQSIGAPKTLVHLQEGKVI
jgi:DNA replication and repair protein RecF